MTSEMERCGVGFFGHGESLLVLALIAKLIMTSIPPRAMPPSRGRHKSASKTSQFTQRSALKYARPLPLMIGQMAKFRFPLAVAACWALAAPMALAQSVNDFRLQPGPAPQPPRGQGPINPENQAPPAQPAPPALPSPAPSAAPAPQTSSGPGPAPEQSTASRTERAPSPPARAGANNPAVAARPTPSASASETTPVVSSSPAATEASPVIAATPTSPPAPAATDTSSQPLGAFPWRWLIGAVLLAGLAAWALLRRRKAEEFAEIERPIPLELSELETGSIDTAVPPPTVALAPDPRPVPEDKTPAPPNCFAIALEPVRMSVSLVNATLHYRLRLTNASAAPLGPISLAFDMIAAHASRSDESQLAQDGSVLELRHEVPALAPGESAEVQGQLRLALSEIIPIHSGSATLFVPLVRLRAESSGLSQSCALVIGETPTAPGGLLRPFRLDQGPRIFGEVSQRELELA